MDYTLLLWQAQSTTAVREEGTLWWLVREQEDNPSITPQERTVVVLVSQLVSVCVMGGNWKIQQCSLNTCHKCYFRFLKLRPWTHSPIIYGCKADSDWDKWIREYVSCVLVCTLIWAYIVCLYTCVCCSLPIATSRRVSSMARGRSPIW